jgi:tetratricopeptide (TPR) repeat protein
MHHPTYYFDMAMRLLEHGEPSGAIEAFTASIALNPNAMSYCYRGFAHFRLKEYDKALADYTKAIELDDPSVPEVHYFRATVNSLMGNNGDAIQDYTKAIVLKGEGWLLEAYFYRGANFGTIGEYDMAIDDMRVAANAGYQAAQEFLKSKGLKW